MKKNNIVTRLNQKERKGKESMSKTTRKRVSDLGAAAYLLMHGYRPTGKQGKDVIFEVELDDERAFEDVYLEYLPSEYHRFDSCLMSLKKLNEYITNSQSHLNSGS